MHKTLTPSQSTPLHLEVMRKVPQVTLFFWIVKLLTTAMGESTSDYLVYHINPYVAVMVGALGLAVSLIIQFAVRRYIPWVYWFAVAMVAVFGTMAADVMHVVLGIPYLVSTTGFTIILIIVFIAWYASEKTLSIHSITTRRRELFYWATVIATFALGTAAGDMTAATLGLGYFASAILFAGLFVLPALAYRFVGLNGIAAFWLAYIMTRPLGASVADWLGKPYLGGLGFGDSIIALALTIAIVICVGFLTIADRKKKDETHRLS